MNLELAYLRASLQGWLENQAGAFPVVRASQRNAVIPSVPFINYRVNSIAPVGTTDHFGPPDPDSGAASISGSRNIGIFLQAFGDGSIQKLMDINEALRNPVILADLQNVGLVFAGTPAGVLNITDVEVSGATELEERASLDLMFRVGLPFTEQSEPGPNLGVIESVDIDGEVDGVVLDFTVPEE